MRDSTEEIVANSQNLGASPHASQVVADQLLEPVLRFLQQAGVSEEEALAAVRSAWRNPARYRGRKVTLTSLADAQPFVDLIATWTRHPNYLDKDGHPRALPLLGRNGFGSLVKRVGAGPSSKAALRTLVGYGNVQMAGEFVVLTKPFFHIRSDESLAFEPSVRFLLDAASNVKSSLDRGRNTTSAPSGQPFWRSVVCKSLPMAKRRAFLSFVRSSSLTFLQDIDDWLSEHAEKAPRASKRVRIGLGLFTVESAAEK